MLEVLRFRLTYANVMATIAVFIALGGSSYAALRVTGRNVPKDALTGADIKNLTGKDVKDDSLTGADVKNLTSADVTDGGLLAADFAPGQLAKGETGAPGAPGAPGADGLPGEDGAPGPSDAFANSFGQTAVPAPGAGSAEPYSRTLEPGSYVISASFRAIASGGPTIVECTLAVADQGLHQVNLDLDATDDRKLVTLLATTTVDAPTVARIACTAVTGAGYNVTHGQVVALRVGELH
jgi:hypothetical protein